MNIAAPNVIAAPKIPASNVAAPKIAAPSAAERKIADAMSSAGVIDRVKVLSATPRVAGSPDYMKAANYVVGEARAAGWDARIIEHSGARGTLYNVVADRRGTAPDAERRVVLAGAHLDSVMRAPGANDDGTGSGTLLEMTRAFQGVDTRNDLRFLWFDGEEKGLLGSRAYVRDFGGTLDNAVVMVNGDMLGSPHGSVAFNLGVNTTNAVADAVKGVGLRNGIQVAEHAERHSRSDHAPFDRVGVPAIDFGVGVRTVNQEDPNYHSSRDTVDKLNPKVLDGMADMFALTVYDFANRGERIPGPRPPIPVSPGSGKPL